MLALAPAPSLYCCRGHVELHPLFWVETSIYFLIYKNKSTLALAPDPAPFGGGHVELHPRSLGRNY